MHHLTIGSLGCYPAAYPMGGRGSVAFMLANDITRDRLRRLAEADAGGAKVLSLFLNLDPREFATPPARSTEVRSLLDRAGRLVRDESEQLTHEQKESLKGDLERIAAELGNGGGTKGAHGLAIFSCSAAGLFEMLRLAEPVDHEPVISDGPYLAPLSSIGEHGQWCVVLVNRRTARLFCGSSDTLDEVALVDDGVRNRHDQGGWSQSNYQRSVDKDVQDHLKHVAEVVFEQMKQELPEGVLVGGPQETVADFEGTLHPYLRERLAGRIDIDVENTSPEDVRRAAAQRIAAAAREREDQALARLAELFGSNGRAASGLADVLVAVHEQRVETLLVDRGYTAPGVCCPQCGFLGGKGFRECPADGTPTERRDDIVEAAIERAITQSANVHVLRDRPELASHGHIAAILRF
jgi:peptide chain release factor subunit 1